MAIEHSFINSIISIIIYKETFYFIIFYYIKYC